MPKQREREDGSFGSRIEGPRPSWGRVVVATLKPAGPAWPGGYVHRARKPTRKSPVGSIPTVGGFRIFLISNIDKIFFLTFFDIALESLGSFNQSVSIKKTLNLKAGGKVLSCLFWSLRDL